MDLIYNFDKDGYLTGVSERPIDPVRGTPAAINESVATLTPVPEHDPTTHWARMVSGAWILEVAPEPEPLPEPQDPVFACSRLQGELALLDEPSPTPDHPTMLHWVEATVDAETDPVRKRTMQAYLNAPTWRSDDPLVPAMWQAAGRDLDGLPALFTKAQGL